MLIQHHQSYLMFFRFHLIVRYCLAQNAQVVVSNTHTALNSAQITKQVYSTTTYTDWHARHKAPVFMLYNLSSSQIFHRQFSENTLVSPNYAYTFLLRQGRRTYLATIKINLQPARGDESDCMLSIINRLKQNRED
jgi:hypothetical protein